MKRKKYALGLDYGTNSCRALLVDLSDGTEMASHVFAYPTGENGILLDPKDPNVARQNPADYITGAIECVKGVTSMARKSRKGFNAADIIGIGIDTSLGVDVSQLLEVGDDKDYLCQVLVFDNFPSLVWDNYGKNLKQG